MKIIICVLLIVCIQTVSAKNKIFLSNVIKNLSSDSIQIVYSNDFINANEIELDSSINSVDELSEYLNTLSYELLEIKTSIYLIKPIQVKSKDINKRVIVGGIFDDESDKRILGATLFVNDNAKSHAINRFSGFALINLEPDTYKFTIRAPGYTSQIFSVDLTNVQYLSKDFTLKKAPERLENLLITTSLFDFYNLSEANQKIMTFDELESTPHLGGDPARAITKIPGLTSNGLSARNHARGGKHNESQIILNGLALRNPYHFKDFFGVFSTINLNYVEELSLFAGVFPVKYGNYISSVMDVQSKSPGENFFLDASLNFFNSHITFGDSLNSGAQYVISYRSGGDTFREGLIELDKVDPSYDDFFLNYSQEYSKGIKIQGNILHSNDKISFNSPNVGEEANAKYIDNDYWSSIFIPITEEVNLNTMIFYQTSKTRRSGKLLNEKIQGSVFEKRDTITYGLSTNLDYKINENTLITFGTNIHREKTNINYISTNNHNNFIGDILNPNNIDLSRNHIFKSSGYSSSFYTNYRYKFNKKLYADIGLRIDNQNWIESNQVSPRLNFSYSINETSVLKFGLGRHFQQQLIDGVLLEDSVLEYFEPEAANIGILEFQKQINSQYSFRSELYFKNYTQVQPYYENLFRGLHLHPELFTDRVRLQPDSAFSRGIDITLSQTSKKHDWSLSYSLSEVKDKFAGNEVLRSWDQKNSIKYSHNWYLGNWQFGSLLQYHSGWPKTLVYKNNAGDIIIGNRNTERNKAYMNLDLKVSRNFNFKNIKMKYWIQLNNALDKENQCCSEYSYEEDENGELVLFKEQKLWLPLLPSMGIDIAF